MSHPLSYCALGRSEHPPVLLLHGFMGDCYEFDQVMDLLSDRFYCLAVDLPGHGKTQVTEDNQDYTIKNTADRLVQFLDTQNIKTCFLIGYSMGGRLALYLTLYFSGYFSKVILESASPGLKTAAERIQRIQNDLKLAQKLETGEFSAFLAQWYDQPLFASLKQHPEFARLLQSRLQNNPIHLAKSLQHLGTGCQPSLWQQLEYNTIPLLLLVGEFDEKFIQINREMVNVCKSAKLEIVDRCGHNIHFEQVSLFVEQVRNFLTVV